MYAEQVVGSLAPGMELLEKAGQFVASTRRQIVRTAHPHVRFQLDIRRLYRWQCSQRLEPQGHLAVTSRCQLVGDLLLQDLSPRRQAHRIEIVIKKLVIAHLIATSEAKLKH